jgi:hypothetical protein
MILVIDQPTYTALRLIQDSLAFMANDPSKYNLAIKKEKELKQYLIHKIYESSH